MDKIFVSNLSLHIGFYFILFHLILTIIGYIANIRFKNSASLSFLKRMKTLWVLILFFAVGLFFYKIVALLFIGILSFLCLKEYYKLMQVADENFKCSKIIYPLIITQCIFLYMQKLENFYIFLPISLVIIPLIHLLIKDKYFIKNSIKECIGIILIPYLCGYLYALLTITRMDGLAIVLFILITTLMTDFAQAIFGFLFGKHKITPTISPNKTIEGFFGGILCSILLTIWIGEFVFPEYNFIKLLLLGGLIGIIGFCGDITFSAIKRYAKVKDSSNLLPGHGGLIDRFDSTLYTVTLVYLYLILM
ncbi:MAG: phosphatidate cytidylyltransferase [bacterium]|nr:phosphatidate cytidylyltransferase [bacterium]